MSSADTRSAEVGRHRRTPSKNRRKKGAHRAPRQPLSIAGPAAAVISVATIALSATASPAQAAVQPEPAVAGPDAAATAWQHPRVQLTAAARHRAMRVTYVVLKGDTLSAIAAREYGNPALWPALWWVNKSHVRDPNMIEVGQRLHLSRWHPQAAWLTAAAGRAIPRPDPPARMMAVVTQRPGGHHDQFDGQTQYGCGDGDRDGRHDMPCSLLHHHGTTTVTVSSGYRARHRAVSSGGSVTPGSSFEACVIARESGGNSQVMNSTGHYGLYQFSASTWAAYGGPPGDFGHASASEQRRVFLSAMASPGGASNWSPYDGC
jgi:Transglycosylase-like domain/LysM domain